MPPYNLVSPQIVHLEAVLQTKALSKSYGRIKAVKSLDLVVPEGAVFGILGPNGSGKSTTLSMVLGILTQDSGDFQWFGKPSSPAIRQQIGALLEQPNFYPYLSARKNLEIACLIKECSNSRIDVVLEQVALLQRADSAFKTFSTGMKQRLAIASAMLADPQVLVLDEPTNGLDPQGIAEVRELIQDIAARGKTILLASHILDEVEKVCTHVAVIKQGTLLAQGSVMEILRNQHQIEVRADDMEALERALAEYPAAANRKREGQVIVLSMTGEHSGSELNRYMFERGIVLTHLRVHKKRLEESFLELTAKA